MASLPSELLFPIYQGEYKMANMPTLRVGVVLAEDGKREVEFVTRGLDFVCVEAKKPDAVLLEFSGVNRYKAYRCSDIGCLQVARWNEGTGTWEHLWRGTSESILQLRPKVEPTERTPGMGLHVRNIVAGRGFHWVKEIDQYLPGMVEIRIHKKSGFLLLINQLSVEDYLIGVITSEMSQDCPMEYMKAQAIAARSWLFAQRNDLYRGEPFDVCNDDQCQRYQGSEAWTEEAIRAIRECAGETLITEFNGYCDARYSKSTGGISEDAEHVWHERIPGLVAMVDAPKHDPIERFFPVTEANLVEFLTGDWLKHTKAYASGNTVNEAELLRYLGRVDVAGEYFRWRVLLTQEELLTALRKRGGLPNIGEVLRLIPQERGRSGRLKRLTVEYRNTGEQIVRRHDLNSEYAIRAGLSTSFLFSSCFIVEETQTSTGTLEALSLIGGGWGHGAGLCQIGGLGRALKGQSYKEILLAYFHNVRLENIYTFAVQL
jgi:stage II sporulation protein D